MIHVYPGMGATSSMYGERWRSAIEGSYHNWPSWSGEQSLPEMAATLIERHGIEPGDTIIGSSLGGMLASEISRTLDIEKLILIGSAVHPSEVRSIFKTLHPIIDLTPVDFVQKCAGIVPIELSRMFAETDPGFIRSMCKAIFQWEGFQPTTELLRLHGTRDPMIAPPKNAHMIEGGHMIAMTHPDACIEVILGS